MERKYFSIGEKVGLESEHYPELNGEYTVSEYGGYHLVRNRVTNVFSHQHLYTLEGCPIPENETSKWWVQSSLRKIHKSGGTSFEYMMTKLKAQESALNAIKDHVGNIKRES